MTRLLPDWFVERINPVPDEDDLPVSTLELFFDLSNIDFKRVAMGDRQMMMQQMIQPMMAQAGQAGAGSAPGGAADVASMMGVGRS